MFLKNRNIIFKKKISKVTDYAALKGNIFLKRTAIDEHDDEFSHYLITIMGHSVHIKIVSYRKLLLQFDSTKCLALSQKTSGLSFCSQTWSGR